MERTEIGSLGEFGLIRHLTSELVTRQPSTLLGVGDDAAVVDPGNKRVLVSTDMLCEGVHFDLSYTPLKHLGYKAIIVNLSDICAMNATPTQVTVSLALSNRFSVEAVEELYAGMLKACELYSVDLVGGDTTTSPAGLVISVTGVGFADRERIVRRNGAKAGNLLVVSGELGGAYMGLQVLEREKHVFTEAPGAQPDLSASVIITLKAYGLVQRSLAAPAAGNRFPQPGPPACRHQPALDAPLVVLMTATPVIEGRSH